MFGWRVALWAILVVLALAFLVQVRHILPPFFIALILSAVLEPLATKMTKRGMKWRGAVVLIWLSAALACTFLAVWLTPTASKQVVNFRDKIESFSTRLAEQTARDNYFLRWNPRYMVTTDPTMRQVDDFFRARRAALQQMGLPSDRRTAVSQYVEPYRQGLTKGVQDFFFSMFGALSTIGSNAMLYAFTPILVLLILLDAERFKQRATALIPPSIRSETVDLISDIFNVFTRYLRGMAVLVMMYITLAAIVLSALGAPYSLLLAVVFGLLYLIPLLGNLLNLTILISLTGLSGKTGAWFHDFGNPWLYAAVVAFVYFAIFTGFDLIFPNIIVGGSVGIHPVVGFFVVFAAGALLGPIGMVFAFPLAGAIKVILDRLLAVTSKPQDLGLPPVPLRHRAT